LCKRAFTIKSSTPIISFTFDDFPRSALSTGGEILRSMGIRGTYYVSLGLAGKQIETGTMFLEDDLRAAAQEGHELGCHTFSHSHSWETAPQSFEAEILRNREALQQVIPGASFKTLSFPIGQPRAGTKKRASKYFSCCRGGGQTFNVGEADLNCLSAYFLEQSRENPDAIKRIIDQNYDAGGWLIFATHDVSQDPTHWGCTPALFEDTVQYAVKSGAEILPVFQAYEALQRQS
jgi:peptidoglycan/xylan/chitin deacetylase (PgdA/CDA1 family)